MTRLRALLGTALFLVLAPGTLAGLIPWYLTRWEPREAFLGLPATRWAGVLLLALGLPVLLDSFLRFALQGLGTPAPVAPTRRLVVGGLYRHVRNPMYCAVLALILGQALLFASGALLVYAGAFWAAVHTFVCVYEEPTLRRTYGADYDAFRAHVPRWLPRLRPWRP